MAMQLTSLEILEKAQFPQDQARAIVRVLEAEAKERQGDLATKADLALVKSDLTKELVLVETKLVRWVFGAVMGQAALICGIMYFLLQTKT